MHQEEKLVLEKEKMFIVCSAFKEQSEMCL